MDVKFARLREEYWLNVRMIDILARIVGQL